MSRVAVVTGANQGLGLALVRGLLQRWGPEDQVYLTARDPGRGQAAVLQLEEEGLYPRFARLDVTSPRLIDQTLSDIVAAHGGLDVVIHNAAARIHPDLSPAQQVRRFVETNNLGTTTMLRALTDRLSPGARVLVLASGFGQLKHLDARLHARFADPTLTLDDLDATMLAYVEAVEHATALAAGWPEWINVPSKVGQVAAMRAFAHQAKLPSGVRVNAVCPGLVDTAASRPWFSDMSRAQSPDEAAEDVLWLAEQPAASDPPVGTLVQKRAVLPFEAG